MKQLMELFEAAGCADVRTYIQSGNVVFGASPALARRVAGSIRAAVLAELGLEVPVVTRSAAELRALVRANPFLEKGLDGRALHVAFLAERPSRARAAQLDPQRSPPDELVLRGREVYLHFPNGVARTRITNAYLDATLGTTSTVRNWRTACTLLELVDG